MAERTSGDRSIVDRFPDLAGKPFLAAFSADAAWLTDLRPAPGSPAAPVLLGRDDRPADWLHLWRCGQHRIAVWSDGTSQVVRFPAWHRSSCLRPVRAGPAELMASSGRHCAWQDRSVLT